MNKKIKCDCVIVCEGKYDKIKLCSIFEDKIICTDGFAIYKNKKMINMLKELAKTKKIVIVCDSDSAGFKIRNYIKKCLMNDNISKENIVHVYIPDIFGKEKRKEQPSKEGKLGVEGISEKIIINAFSNAGLLNNSGNDEYQKKKREAVTKADFYQDGLSGKADSSQKRKNLKKMLNLPENLSQNALLDVINILISKEEYKLMVQTIAQKSEK